MIPKNIFLDMDGVMNNFGRDFITYASDFYNNLSITWEEEQYGYDIHNWFKLDGESDRWYVIEIMEEPLFWEGLTRNNAFHTAMEDLQLVKKHNVYVCTLPFSWSFCPNEKANWLEENYPSIDIDRNLIMMEDKQLLAGNGILIDDCPDNVRNFMEAGGEAYLYETFYNYAEDLPKIKSLYDLEGYI